MRYLMPWRCWLLIWLLAFPLSPLRAATLTTLQPATVPRGMALVIGNAAYQTDPLHNPGNDATDMAETLHQLGFMVTLLLDANLREMEDLVEQFARRLHEGKPGLFYFSGHGVQIAGENYLIPLGARIEREQDVRYEAMPVGRVLGALEEARNTLNIIILDACRNNPFVRGWRSPQSGLAMVQAGLGMLIAYATAPGKVAADGYGRNGTYTKHLLQSMTTPGLSIERVFKQVRLAVIEETGGQQTPWESSSLTGDFYFVPSQNPIDKAPGTTVAVGVYPATPPPESMWPKTLRNSISVEFVLIPAGEFLMGSHDGNADERPVHRVRLSRPFYLGKHEVTQAQWETVMRSNPSGFKGDPNRPVERVSWEDVQEFIRRLNAREGGTTYRLPTEAEWEYAARAGSTTTYSFGEDSGRLGTYAWYWDNAGKQSHPVGQLMPNAWGLHDMHGNVREWVQDWYSAPYTMETEPDPQGPVSGSSRVNRDCSWANSVRFCRSTKRSLALPGDRFDLLGFRLLKAAP